MYQYMSHTEIQFYINGSGIKPFLSFVLFFSFNPCLFLLSCSPSPHHHSLRHSPLSHGSRRNTQRVESGLSCPVCLFHVNPGTRGQVKKPTCLSQTGTKSDKLSDPVSCEDFCHCLHQGDTPVHKVLKGQVKFSTLVYHQLQDTL